MVKTTARNQVFVVQKKVKGQWQMLTEGFFLRRSMARELSNELNNLRPHPGRGPNRRYRVAKLEIAPPRAVS